jgi:hypothetical protein
MAAIAAKASPGKFYKQPADALIAAVVFLI